VLNYNHLFYFHVAASEGSLAKAAERLGVTQPTVSEQIRQLERKLGVTLFARSTAGLRLTEQGRRAFLHTTPMFREGEKLIAVLDDKPIELVRRLKVGITDSVAHELSSDFLLPLLSIPECAPNVRRGDFADLLRELQTRQLDILLCDTEPAAEATSGLEIREVHRPQLVAVAAPDLGVADDWAGTPVLQYSNGSSHRWEIQAFLEAHALRPRIAGELDDPRTMLEAAIRGTVVAFVPRIVAREAIAARRVRSLVVLEPAAAAVQALFHDSALATSAVARLAEHAATLAG
jgi:LysR family transcriptional activator of nhaA